MSTHSKAGDSQKLGSRIIFGEVLRRSTLKHGLCNLLTVGAMDVVKTDQQKAQSNHMAPVVLVSDLTKSHGDNVSVDIIHEADGAPIMGDAMIEGKDEPLTRSSFELKIDQYRKSVSQGGKMTQQRRGYNMVSVGKQALTTYFPKLKTEIMLAHMAGARGEYTATDIILPTAASGGAALASYLVNPVTAPTFDRQFYGGNAGSIDGTTGDSITQADVFDLTSLDRLSAALEEMAHPPQAVDFSTEDKPMDTDPFHIFFVTPRMWRDFQQNAGRDYHHLVAQATRRKEGFNHHLFRGDMLMHENILVRKYHCPVRFFENSSVQVCDDNDQATEHREIVPAGVTVDRGILLGGQALAMALGKTQSGNTFKMVNQKYDGENKHRSILEWMAGLSKVRFKDKAGRMNDYGICAMDCAVTLDG